eukprot:8053536-Lingulodinium_polyedra.AAC.1
MPTANDEPVPGGADELPVSDSGRAPSGRNRSSKGRPPRRGVSPGFRLGLPENPLPRGALPEGGSPESSWPE